jgi:hypothetical protein
VSVVASATIFELDWGTVDPDVSTVMPHFYNDIAGSGYLQSLEEYSNAGSNVIYGGHYTVTPAPPGNPVSDANVQDMVAQIAATRESFPNAMLYAVHLPPGYTGTDNTGKNSCGNWCAYHAAANTVDQKISFMYAVLPDQNTLHAAPCNSGCYFTGAGPINETTKVASHEIIEALTDPWDDGGYKLNGYEIGDLCNGDSKFPTPVDGGNGFTTIPARNGPPWFVQAPYSFKARACVVYAPWVYTPPSYTGSGFAFARAPYHMDIFRTANNGSVVSADWDVSNGGSNSKWLNVPGTLGNNSGVSWRNTPVSGIARYETHMDIFSAPSSFGFPAQFPSEWWDASLLSSPTFGWNAFEVADVYNNVNLPAPGKPLSVTARNPSSMDVFYLSTGGEIFDVGYDTTNGWSPHASATANLSEDSNPDGPTTGKPVNLGPPTAISRNPDVLEVFAVDGSGTIWGWSYSASAAKPLWYGPFSVTALAGGPPVSPGTHIAAFARNPDKIELFAADDAGAVQSYFWNSGTWGFVQDPLTRVNGVLPPGSTVPGAGVGVGGWGSHVDVVTTSKSHPGQLVVAWWDDYMAPNPFNVHRWTSYEVGSNFTLGQPIHVVTRYVHSLDVFGLQPDGSIEWLSYDGQGHWTGPVTALQGG